MTKSKLLFFVTFLFLFPQAVLAANPVINGDTTTEISDVLETSHTISYTVTAANNEVLFLYAFDNDLGLSTATYNAVSMTVVTCTGGTSPLSYAYLAAPATGTHNLVVNWAGSPNHSMVHAMTVTAVKQSALIGATDCQKVGTAQTSAQHVLSTLTANSLLIQSLFVNGDGTGITDGSGTGQVLVVQTNNTNTQHLHTAYENTTTTVSQTFSETWTGASPQVNWIVELLFQATSTPVVTTARRRVFRHF